MDDTTTHDSDDAAKLFEVIDGIPIGMFTTIDERGHITSRPMARQEVEPSAQLWFITARDTDHIAHVKAQPRVGVTFSSRDAWASVTGLAEVVDDPDRLREYWDTFADAWMPEGPEDPNAVLVRVDIDGGEYWDTPGGTVATIVSFVKSRVTGTTFEADHATVEP